MPTTDEKKVLLLIADLWRKYQQLEVLQTSDEEDFAVGIRTLQRIVMSRNYDAK